jgi:hypothetical protein
LVAALVTAAGARLCACAAAAVARRVRVRRCFFIFLGFYAIILFAYSLSAFRLAQYSIDIKGLVKLRLSDKAFSPGFFS